MEFDFSASLSRIKHRLPVLGSALMILAACSAFTGEYLPAAADGVLTVVVDPGHGGSDCGAVSPGGTEEAGLNLSVALLIREELELMGARVIMTREDQSALAPTKKGDMAARRRIMNGPGVDMVISVHMNKFPDPAVSGPMAFYMEGSQDGRLLGEIIIRSITHALGRPPRHANPGDYFVLRESTPVAVLVECGFLSNSQDEKLLQDPSHQRLIACAVAQGAFEFYREGNMLD